MAKINGFGSQSIAGITSFAREWRRTCKIACNFDRERVKYPGTALRRFGGATEDESRCFKPDPKPDANLFQGAETDFQLYSGKLR